jgi:cation transport regulator
VHVPSEHDPNLVRGTPLASTVVDGKAMRAVKSLQQEAKMPYQKRSELPESVRDNLPAHAQDIYKEAFNSAWDEYGHDESRAHRVAWGAVERKYHKDRSGKWVEGATEETARR